MENLLSVDTPKKFFVAAMCNAISNQVRLLILFDARQREVTISWIQHDIVVIKLNF